MQTIQPQTTPTTTAESPAAPHVPGGPSTVRGAEGDRSLAARITEQAVRARRSGRALVSEVGQGTVEYVGLLLLMATLLAAIVAAAGSLGGKDQIGKKVVTQIGKSIDKAGAGER